MSEQQEPGRVQHVIIRALARHPHKQYWAGRMPWKGGPRGDGTVRPEGEINGLPWPDSKEVRVAVVDNPRPFDPADGVATEISHATLEEIRRDVRVAVQILGSDVADSQAVIEAKASLQKIEQDLQEARLDLAQSHEDRAKAEGRATFAEKQAQDALERVAQLQASLDEALATARGRKAK